MQTNIYIYILFLDLCFEVKILTSETQTFVYPMMIEYFNTNHLPRSARKYVIMKHKEIKWKSHKIHPLYARTHYIYIYIYMNSRFIEILKQIKI